MSINNLVGLKCSTFSRSWFSNFFNLYKYKVLFLVNLSLSLFGVQNTSINKLWYLFNVFS